MKNWLALWISALFLIFIMSVKISLFAQEERRSSLLLVGGGCANASNYSEYFFQLEYQHGHYLWQHLRPQITFLVSRHYSRYIGFGIGWEFYLTKQLIVTPSFSPGIYWKGNGRNLGCLIEFRSALEIAYEMDNHLRMGMQISHLSNAHLSRKNPGLNALTLFLAFSL